VPDAHRGALELLRASIRRIVPEAQEVISYRIPAFRIEAGVIAGFASYKDHMSYFPFSGSVLAQLSSEISGYAHTKSALHFTVERPLNDDLVERLIAVRGEEILTRGR
jgi:uncharacterized protein YdhG (YjbR/CyaY superfamily)